MYASGQSRLSVKQFVKFEGSNPSTPTISALVLVVARLIVDQKGQARILDAGPTYREKDEYYKKKSD